MSAKKGSCLKKLGIGCAGFVGLFILLGGMLAASMALNKAQPPKFAEVSTGESFSVDPESNLNLPGQKSPQKPIRLVLESSMSRFKVQPGQQLGKIEIDSKYDTANFELVTEVKEKKDVTEYHIRFKNIKSLLSLAINEDMVNSDNNSVTVKLPKDLLFQIKGNFSKGSHELDLSGLAVNGIDVESSMGELDIRMEEPNQVAMDKMQVDGSMGEVNVYDIQNYGFKQGRIKGNMGEFRVHSSAMLEEDMNLFVKVSMGTARINIPENAILEHSGGAFMGESRFPSKDPDYEGEKATVTLRGGATMGEFRVGRSNKVSSRRRDLTRLIKQEGVQFYVDELRETYQTSQGSPKLRPSFLNNLGYSLLANEDYEAAIEIFKLNVEFNSDYANGYDSLADAYKRNGQLDLSLEHYRTALEMDPTNDNARRNIAELEGDGQKTGETL